MDGFGRQDLSQPPPGFTMRNYPVLEQTQETKRIQTSNGGNSETVDRKNYPVKSNELPEKSIEVNSSKRKRIRRKEKKRKTFSLKLFGNNVDGILKKLESLENLKVSENPSVLFL